MKKQTPDKNRTKLPHEVFAEVAAATSVDKRVKILTENATFGIKTILQANFKSDVKFDLPEGAPPYKEDQGVPGFQSRPFEKAIKDLRHCIVQNPLPRYKKEALFIKLLEVLYKDDAKIIIAMKDKKLGELYKGLTEHTVRKAFPNLLPPV